MLLMVLAKKNVLVFSLLALVVALPAWTRSFDDIFPGLDVAKRGMAFSGEGIIRSLEKGEIPELNPAPGSGINLRSRITQENAYLTESLLVVPYSGRTLTVLDAYNALGKVRNLKGRLYHSHTKNAEIPLFEDATRLEGAKRTGAIPDPPQAAVLPVSESVYIRLKDVNFGNSYYRADITRESNGLLYSLTNFKSLTYLFFPVMKEEKFSALLYLEPLSEGMLVYSIAGTEVSDFIASKIDIPSAIGKRLAVFIDWVAEGIKEIR
ncbi:MAG: hypothetical protein LBC62_07905 [Treponema sp.]|jgi:hypothetical protein|nr:hypothetical protein [Treponema sp.]